MSSTQKMLKIAIILLVVLIFIIIGLMIYFNISEKIKESKSFKVYIDNVRIKEIPEGLLKQDLINGDIKVSIELMANLLNYDFYFGEYLGSNESQAQCYVQNGLDVIAFYKDSKRIYKTSTFELDWGYYNLRENVLEIDGNLSVSLEGAKIGFNSLFAYDEETNELNIRTLQNLVDECTIKVIEWGYLGLESSYNNQKALLEGLLVVEKNGKYGVIAIDKRDIIRVEYDNITYIEDTKEFYVTKSNKIGIISSTGKEIIKVEYDTIKLLDKDLGLWCIYSNKMYGVLDKNGDTVLYKEFDSIGIDKTIFENDIIKNNFLLLNNVIPVKKDNKWGLYDKTGNEIISIICDSIGYVNSSKPKDNLLLIPEIDSIIIGKNGKYGIIDKEGKIIVPLQYDKIYFEMQNGTRQYFLRAGNDVSELQDIITGREEMENNRVDNTTNTTVENVMNNTTNTI